MKKTKLIKSNKLNMYTLYRPKSKDWRYSPPFYGLNDEQVLATFIEMSKTHPEIANSYIYHLGEFDTLIGKYKALKVARLVEVPKVKKVKKVNKNEKVAVQN